MTTNQRDILAGVLTAVCLYDGAGVTYKEWVETYEYYREKISEYVEREKDDKDQ